MWNTAHIENVYFFFLLVCFFDLIHKCRFSKSNASLEHKMLHTAAWPGAPNAVLPQLSKAERFASEPVLWSPTPTPTPTPQVSHPLACVYLLSDCAKRAGTGTLPSPLHNGGCWPGTADPWRPLLVACMPPRRTRTNTSPNLRSSPRIPTLSRETHSVDLTARFCI